jgi:hypothetical protein
MLQAALLRMTSHYQCPSMTHHTTLLVKQQRSCMVEPNMAECCDMRLLIVIIELCCSDSMKADTHPLHCHS